MTNRAASLAAAVLCQALQRSAGGSGSGGERAEEWVLTKHPVHGELVRLLSPPSDSASSGDRGTGSGAAGAVRSAADGGFSRAATPQVALCSGKWPGRQPET